MAEPGNDNNVEVTPNKLPIKSPMDRPEKPETSNIEKNKKEKEKKEKKDDKKIEPISGDTVTVIDKTKVDYIPDSETPVDNALREELKRIQNLMK